MTKPFGQLDNVAGLCILLCLPAIRGDLPSADEYAKVRKCAFSGNVLDITAPAEVGLLPPCVESCPAGREVIAQQCVWPSQGQEVLRLRFELRHWCKEPDCAWAANLDLHLQVAGMKVAQLLGLPVEELQGAILAWPVDAWPPPESSPSLEKFIITRRGEPDFSAFNSTPNRRASGTDRWHVATMAFRADTARISRWSRSVRMIADGDNSELSKFFGVPVEVSEPEVQSHRRTEEVFARDDYRVLYQFSGFTLNEYPFGQGRYSPNATTTTAYSRTACDQPCFRVDERVLASHCRDSCDCNGQRRCSEHGYCTGASGSCTEDPVNGGEDTEAELPVASPGSVGTTTSAKPTVIPGYHCERSNGRAGAAGMWHADMTFVGCAALCTSAPTCNGIEWRMPGDCFLIAQRHGLLDGVVPNGAWSVCIRLPETTTTTPPPAQTWLNDDSWWTQLDPGCRSAIMSDIQQVGLDSSLRLCRVNLTAYDCNLVSCDIVQTLTQSESCVKTFCEPEAANNSLYHWLQKCSDAATMALIRYVHLIKCSTSASQSSNSSGVSFNVEIYDDPDESLGVIVLLVVLPIMCCLVLTTTILVAIISRRLLQARDASKNSANVEDFEDPNMPDTCKWAFSQFDRELGKFSEDPGDRWAREWGPEVIIGGADDRDNQDAASGSRSARVEGNQSTGSQRRSRSRTISGNSAGSLSSRSRSVPGVPSSTSSTTAGFPDTDSSSSGASARSSEEFTTPAPPRRSSTVNFDSSQRSWRHSSAPSRRSNASGGFCDEDLFSQDGPAFRPPGAPDMHEQFVGPRSAADPAASSSSNQASRSEGSRRRQRSSSQRSSRSQPSKRDGSHRNTSRQRGHSSDRESTEDFAWQNHWRSHSNSRKTNSNTNERPTRSKSVGAPQVDNTAEQEDPLVRDLLEEIHRLRQSASIAVRQRYFKDKCLQWHPDKNAGQEARATKIFQVLQEKKKWFLADD